MTAHKRGPNKTPKLVSEFLLARLAAAMGFTVGLDGKGRPRALYEPKVKGRPGNRSKYAPHQGRRECHRRLFGGIPAMRRALFFAEETGVKMVTTAPLSPHVGWGRIPGKLIRIPIEEMRRILR